MTLIIAEFTRLKNKDDKNVTFSKREIVYCHDTKQYREQDNHIHM